MCITSKVDSGILSSSSLRLLAAQRFLELDPVVKRLPIDIPSVLKGTCIPSTCQPLHIKQTRDLEVVGEATVTCLKNRAVAGLPVLLL